MHTRSSNSDNGIGYAANFMTFGIGMAFYEGFNAFFEGHLLSFISRGVAAGFTYGSASAFTGNNPLLLGGVGFCYKVLHSPTNLFFPVELVGYSVGVAAFSYGLSCQRNSKKAVAQRNESVNAPEWKESAASKPSLTFWKKKTDDAATRHDEAVNKPSLSINIGAALPASSQVLPANPIGSGVNPLVSQVNLRQVQAIPRVEEEKPVKSIISFEKLQAYSKRFRLFGAHHTSRAKAVLGALQNADSDKTRLKLIQNQINLLAGNAGSLQLGIDTRWTMKAVSNKPKDISTSDYYQLLIALEKEITTAHLRVNRR